jgi:hypothetical protein
MAELSRSTDEEETAVYEIRLQGAPPEPLRRQFPTATVITTRTETVLFRRVEEPADLDLLIEELLSMGLVLTEVHELLLPQAGARLGESPPAGRGDDHGDEL